MVIGVSERRIVISSLLLLLCLSACGGLTRSDKPAVTTWWLVPYTGVAQVSAAAPSVPVSVSVTVVPGLDNDRILTLTSDSELKPYLAARWVENLPELASSLISRSLEATGRFEVIPPGGRSSVRKCELQLELREFFSSLDSSGQSSDVRVAFEGRYQCASNEAVQLHLKASLPVRDSRMKSIVAAFQQAMDMSMSQMLVQLSDNGY
jgi:ABC-type uncharacterized transport system auxiliary subunit